MKRRLDEYFIKPKKILKTKFLVCEKCGVEVFHSIFDVHCCEIKGKEKKTGEKKNFHPVFLRIMQTCQQDISADLNIEYEGLIEKKHKWRYCFGGGRGVVSKTHFLKLSKMDPREIRLTFSSGHVGQQVHFFDCVENKKFSIGEFKSLIQKAIRRGNRQSAVKTALQFACNFG